MPACPWPASVSAFAVRPALSPRHGGIELNRMHDFHGEPQRDPSTRYLDAVWLFIEETSAAAQSLIKICVQAAAEGRDPAGATARALLDGRIGGLTELAANAHRERTAAAMMRLARERTRAFVEAARLARLDFMVDAIAASPGASAGRS
jgi:hypothetical protein